LKFIETRFGLEPLNDRDGKAMNLDNAFDFAPASGEGTAKDNQ